MGVVLGSHAVAEPMSANEPCVTVVISLHSKIRSVPHLKRPQTSAAPSAPLARSLYESTWCEKMCVSRLPSLANA